MRQALFDFFRQYGPTPTDVTQELVSRFRVRTLSKGDHLLRAGDVCRELIYVQSGCLRMYSVTEIRELSLWFALPDSLATELTSFITQQPSDFFVEALEDCALLVLPKAELDALCQTHPGLHALLRQLWEEIMVHVIYRFTSLQHDTAEQRYLALLKNPEYLQTIPQKYLASFIGVTPSSLSRIRRKLAQAH